MEGRIQRLSPPPAVPHSGHIDPQAAHKGLPAPLHVCGHGELDALVGDAVDACVEHRLGDGVGVPAARIVFMSGREKS